MRILTFQVLCSRAGQKEGLVRLRNLTPSL